LPDNRTRPVRICSPTSAAEHAACLELRWQLLRAPWNQPRGSEQDDREGDSIHLMAVTQDGTVAGVGRLHFNSIREAQIRYMAVATRYQRQGIGTRLLVELEKRARQLGAMLIVLNARETSLGFYRRHGYRPVGPGAMLFNRIAHVRMRKDLADRAGISR
jgi:ribosomal protein S18 acetylase RimI-like enzyme